MLRGASRGRFGRRIGPTATLLLSVHDLRVDFFKTIERLVLELVFDSSRASSVCDAARVWCDCGLLWWRVVIACFESATRRVVILRGSMFVDFRLAAARSKRTAWCDVWCCCAVCPEGSAAQAARCAALCARTKCAAPTARCRRRSRHDHLRQVCGVGLRILEESCHTCHECEKRYQYC